MSDLTDSANTYASPLAPPLPKNHSTAVHWARLYGSAPALAAVNAANRWAGPTLVVAPDEQQAYWLEQEIRFYAAGQDLPVSHFLDWETLPYDMFSPYQDIVSTRLETLYKLPGLKNGIVIATAATLMQRIAPRSWLDGSVFILNTGDTLDIEATRSKLEAAGYSCVSQVREHGEFAVRGALFDLFPMGAKAPYRIDLFDNEVESIRLFDPETQLTTDKIKRIAILPAREFPLHKEAIRDFRSKYRARFEGDPQRCVIYSDISRGVAPGGIEYYLPLFFDTTASLFDYLPDDALCLSFGDVAGALEHSWEQAQERFAARCGDLERPILKPEEILFSPGELNDELNRYARVQAQRYAQSELFAQAHDFATQAPPSVPINPRAEEPAKALLGFLAQQKNSKGRVLFVADSTGRRETLAGLLREQGISISNTANWRSFVKADTPVAITTAMIDQGLQLHDPELGMLSVVVESQLFGEKAKQIRKRRRARDPAAIIKDLGDLQISSPVVHEEHGVGLYQGLKTLTAGGQTNEFLVLQYAEENTLYVPVHALNLISRYTGVSPENAPVHKLGGGQWAKARKKAAEKARDVAAELLDIHARRAAHKGYAFQLEDHEYTAFSSQFPFEETEDQATTIEQVIADLTTEKTMDRVVCGDVGFGKTEVALRAAFVAVNGGKQVSVLVPTTLLAQQHYQNFQDRFADWPVKVELLSRFRTQKEQTGVMQGLESGKIDIVVGTHKLLQASTKFKNLGLVIVDEEHRFGVRHKEQLKKMRAEVDLLTLTATPIPRTLNMALSGLRDMSVIATPPANRLAVKTFVSQWNDALVIEAIQRELRRGGQIYFLHNKVENIEKVAQDLRDLVPDAKVQIGHGQMRESELEQVMLDFYHRRFDILVATTIIESGIDIPNANTILINRADHFGLAQLHQLRGRVGRSHHRAYCYLLVPPEKAMTTDAKKRIEAIESLEDLGAGFTLATHDMEIRGAGELLGDEQSGHIQEIGFSLYSDLLERAVKALKSGQEPDLIDPLAHAVTVELQIPALIPDEYIPDVHTRLVLYKRIANAGSAEALRELQVEMIDRFGLLPSQTMNLFGISGLRQLAESLGVENIESGAESGRIVFNQQPNIDPMAIIKLIQFRPDHYQFDGKQTLRFKRSMPDGEERIAAITKLLNGLAHKEAS